MQFNLKIYLIVFIFQILFNLFKTLEIKYTYENKTGKLMINSIWINLVSLAGMFFSLDALFNGDWWVIPFYIGGSIIGKWIAMTNFKQKNKESII